MPHVFLSHSSADSAGAKAVAQLLRNAGVAVWLDLEQLRPGEQWSSALETALKESSHFVILVGAGGVQRWVDREVRYAIDRNTGDPKYRLIPLLSPGANENTLPLFLKQHQYLKVDWRNPEASVMQSIAAAILETAPERVSTLPPGASPFRGLLPFDMEHSPLFFGRDREVDEMLDCLGKTRFLPVIGDSGCGKSSLIRAGLLPALLRGRIGTIDWRIATMKPGADPLDTVAEAIPLFDPAIAPADCLKLIGEAKVLLHREGHVDALSEIIAALQLPETSRQLLVIDQFEQLFTLEPRRDCPASAAARFIDMLLSSAQRVNSALQVVITLRTDFFGFCHPYPELWRLLTGHHYSVRRMDRERLRDVIVKPMALAGVLLDPGLADTIIEEAGTQPGALALLEHALDQLWRECKGDSPTSDHYNRIGRLKGAIRTHADWVLNNRLGTKARRDMGRRIFVELTALGEGTEDSARRVPKANLLSMPGECAEEVLQILTDERLVSAGDADDPEGIAVAHEALIREWGTLRGWVDEKRQDIRFQRDLEKASEMWRKSNRDRDQLLRGARLAQAIDWNRRNAAEIQPELKMFIADSRRRSWRATVIRFVSVATLLGLLLFVALPVVEIGWYSMWRFLARGRVNSKDGLKYIYIPPGEFRMGCSDAECAGDDRPQHLVHITKGFWIGQTEVTQAAYTTVTERSPSRIKGTALPVERVTWNDAFKYCEAVGMRLPTEAEWEYAARARNPNELYGDLNTISWNAFNSDSTGRAGVKRPNSWGLYDMLGNVWEWTNDWYDEGYYNISPRDDPRGPSEGVLKVLRGGSWYSNPPSVRMSVRYKLNPSNGNVTIGFRCAGESP